MVVLRCIIRRRFLGAFGRQCRTDDDKVRLLSVVSRSSLSDDVPLMDDVNSGSSDIDEKMEMKAEADPFGGQYFEGVDATIGQLIDVTETTTHQVRLGVLFPLELFAFSFIGCANSAKCGR